MDKELQFLIYNTPEENVSVNAVIKDETIWLTQKAMAELFGVGVPAISKHLANIYAEGELNEISTVSKMEIVQQEGSRDIKRNMEFYNLDAIISVGYRVNSRKATNFRIWATGILKEYMIKGFAMDDERLKQGKTAFGKDYFKELLERVRSIRASERRIWQQIRASTGNRAKESLIVAFINQTDLDEIQDKASIIDAFFQFAQKEQKREAEELIMEEKLNEEAAKRYILTSLRKEYASENGTDLNEILPKMSPLNPQYHTKKQSVFEKISTFVEKFKGVGGVI